MDREPPPSLQPPESFSFDSSAGPRSPEKQPTTPHDFDPLLNLSPSTIIELLRGADGDDPQDALHHILKDVSAAERAFGLRAAIASKKINDWCSELLSWYWPGNFEALLADEADELPLEGSLPAEAVMRLESRVEAIRDEYDELDLEELKSFVRSAHLTPSSRASSLYEVDLMALSQFRRLDDFTALVTATIMHALPYLQQLRRLLDLWSVRLLVLHQVPGFLVDLESTRTAVDAAWKAIGYGTTTEKPHISRDAFETMRNVLQAHVAELGTKLDAMLDALEGLEDRLPDHWIDDMEAVQADCENWVVVAEREVEEGEWRSRQSLDITEPVDMNLVSEATADTGEEIVQDRHDAHAVEHKPWDSIAVSEQSSDVGPDSLQLSRSLGVDGSIPVELLESQINSHASTSLTATQESSESPSLPSVESSVVASSPVSLSTAYQPHDLKPSNPSESTIDSPTQNSLASTQKPSDLSLTPSKEPMIEEPVLVSHPGTRESADLSPPPSAVSSTFSDVSEARIMDASPIQLIKSPIEEKSFFPSRNSFPPDQFRHESGAVNTVETSSSDTNNKDETQPGAFAHHSRGTSFSSFSVASDDGDTQDAHSPDISSPRSHFSHASVASIEIVPRKEVRNITITRSSSNASTINHNRHKDEDGISRVSTPSGLKNETRNLVPLKPSSRSPSPDFSTTSTLRVPKHRDVSPTKADTYEHLPEQDDEFLNAIPSIESSTQADQEPKTLEDQLAARISSILHNIPANIRLRSRFDEETPDGKLRSASHQARSTSASVASRATTPALTLAPAAEKLSRPKANQDQSGIKLYHLHQPDREQPIKLYVRLVGEGGERVMVRVGGGWADLGEYLKEYALHHGRRSASEGKFGVLGIPDADHNLTPWVEPGDGGRVTPDSFSKTRKTRDTSAAPNEPPRTPEPVVGQREETPGSTSSARSGSHLEDDTPLGLAGPKNKDVELSPKKRAWVNGMLNQARQASAEKKKTNLAELGKVGSTRRFFRGKGGGRE